MSSFFISESGRLLEAAKRAAMDAVAGYSNVTPYTIGIAVQAAIDVLHAGQRAGIEERVTATVAPGAPMVVQTRSARSR